MAEHDHGWGSGALKLTGETLDVDMNDELRNRDARSRGPQVRMEQNG